MTAEVDQLIAIILQDPLIWREKTSALYIVDHQAIRCLFVRYIAFYYCNLLIKPIE